MSIESARKRRRVASVRPHDAPSFACRYPPGHPGRYALYAAHALKELVEHDLAFSHVSGSSLSATETSHLHDLLSAATADVRQLERGYHRESIARVRTSWFFSSLEAPVLAGLPPSFAHGPLPVSASASPSSVAEDSEGSERPVPSSPFDPVSSQTFDVEDRPLYCVYCEAAFPAGHRVCPSCHRISGYVYVGPPPSLPAPPGPAGDETDVVSSPEAGEVSHGSPEHVHARGAPGFASPASPVYSPADSD